MRALENSPLVPPADGSVPGPVTTDPGNVAQDEVEYLIEEEEEEENQENDPCDEVSVYQDNETVQILSEDDADCVTSPQRPSLDPDLQHQDVTESGSDTQILEYPEFPETQVDNSQDVPSSQGLYSPSSYARLSILPSNWQADGRNIDVKPIWSEQEKEQERVHQEEEEKLASEEENGKNPTKGTFKVGLWAGFEAAFLS